jgi:hypothetical protein
VDCVLDAHRREISNPPETITLDEGEPR